MDVPPTSNDCAAKWACCAVKASEVIEKSCVAEERLEAELSAKKKLEEHEPATVGATKLLCLAWRIHAGTHSNQYPTNISQVKKELGGNFEICRDRLNGLEILSGGSDRNDDAHYWRFENGMSDRHRTERGDALMNLRTVESLPQYRTMETLKTGKS